MSEQPEVLVRFNTHHNVSDPHSKEWRVIIDGTEKLCNEILIFCPSKTSKNFMEEVGWKWHIQCLATEIEFEKDGHYDDDLHFKTITLK